MTDYKENSLVVQSNQFIRQTSNNLKANEIKMFDIFVSCIDTMKPKNTISISKSELVKALNIGDENYTYTREILESLFKKSWKEIKDRETKYHHFIDEMIWKHYENIVIIKFNKEIMPMLVNLKQNFLQYSVSDLNNLNSRYSMLMYKYILSYVRQYKKTEFYIYLNDLRIFLNLGKKYPSFKELNRRILKTIETEINNSKSLPYLIRYEPSYNGKKVDAIRIYIRPRTSNKETNFLDIDNQLVFEKQLNNLIKGNLTDFEIKNNQADMILDKEI